ncbi:unnamed protein product [Heterosigma akashiwo]
MKGTSTYFQQAVGKCGSLVKILGPTLSMVVKYTQKKTRNDDVTEILKRNLVAHTSYTITYIIC